MSKTKIISSGKMNKEGWEKVGKSLLLTMGAAVIGWIGDSINIIDYGSAETILATCLPFIVNFLTKWLGKYKSQ